MFWGAAADEFKEEKTKKYVGFKIKAVYGNKFVGG